MKKQILILTIFIAALIAGMNSYGQLTGDGNPVDYTTQMYLSGAADCVAPVPLTCAVTSDALHPAPGETYTYSVTVTKTPDEIETIRWFVTDDLSIIENLNDISNVGVDPIDGSYVLAAGTTTGTAYNSQANSANTIDITWKSWTPDPATPVLLVTYVIDENDCTDNIEVYRIEPVFNFTLDMGALADGGTIFGAVDAPTAGSECVSPIETALYNATTSELNMDYGENWIFYTINAANWAHSWMPEFTLNYAGSTANQLEMAWTYSANANDPAATWYTVTDGGSGIWTGAQAVMAQDPLGAVGSAGECIVVRVRIDHALEENADPTAPIVTLGVNGTMYDAVNGDYANTAFDDLGEGPAGSPCPQVDFDDTFIYNLTPRPLVESTTPASATDPTIQTFETKN